MPHASERAPDEAGGSIATTMRRSSGAAATRALSIVFRCQSGTNSGTATAVHCSNVSGQTAGMRFVVLSAAGAVKAELTLPIGLPHGVTITLATHGIAYFTEVDLATGAINQGMLNVESTQSGVFCSAMMVDAVGPAGGVALNMVRVNAHPGTEE